MESFGTGSGGTIVGSATGSGGAGGRVGGAVEAFASGGGAGLDTGGAFFPHAAMVSPDIKIMNAAERILIVCSCRSG
jgi:hypothetical protein